MCMHARFRRGILGADRKYRDIGQWRLLTSRSLHLVSVFVSPACSCRLDLALSFFCLFLWAFRLSSFRFVFSSCLAPFRHPSFCFRPFEPLLLFKHIHRSFFFGVSSVVCSFLLCILLFYLRLSLILTACHTSTEYTPRR